MNKYIKDTYSRARGWRSAYLFLHCEKCNNFVAKYQKDGPGPLKRLYLDRIIEPQTNTKYKNAEVKNIPNLTCTKCNHLLGIPYIYPAEDRLAFRLFVGAVVKTKKPNS